MLAMLASNTWHKNLGDSAEPDGLCSPPTGNEPPPHHGGGHHEKPKKHRDPCKCTRSWRSDRGLNARTRPGRRPPLGRVLC